MKHSLSKYSAKFMKTSGAREMPVRVTNENSNRPRPQKPTGHLLENQHLECQKKSHYSSSLSEEDEKYLYSMPNF